MADYAEVPKVPETPEETEIAKYWDEHGVEFGDRPEVLLKKISELCGVELVTPRATPHQGSLEAVTNRIVGTAAILEGANVYVQQATPLEQVMAKRVIVLDKEDPDGYWQEFNFMEGNMKADGHKDRLQGMGPVNELTKEQLTKFDNIMFRIGQKFLADLEAYTDELEADRPTLGDLLHKQNS